MMSSPQLILASASPRRRDLLNQIGLEPTVIVAEIDETPLFNEAPEDYVLRLAKEKAQSVVELHPEAVVLAADTIIALDGNLLGKPLSKQHAFDMWRAMSGREHQVLTGIAVCFHEKIYTEINVNQVEFTRLDEVIMEAYWQSGEPYDKAGAYAIQGYAAQWIKSIHGSYSGIMGLPLYETAKLLRQTGIESSYE